MIAQKYHIKKDDDLIMVKNNEGRVVYSSNRNSVVRVDKHPYLAGFSKLVDFGSSYREFLKNVQRSPSQSIRKYCENVGTYTLDVMADNDS